MPPDPPAGGHNVRFANGKIVRSIAAGQGLVPIHVALSRVTYPITFRWDIQEQNNVSYWVRVGMNRTRLQGSGRIVVPHRIDGRIRLEAQVLEGNTVTGMTSVKSNRLHDATPNPFNPATSLYFDITQTSHVTVSIYNLLGQMVSTLIDEIRDPGQHSATWEATGLASGVYLARLTVTGDQGQLLYARTSKLMLMK